jgi:hypothetical protein
VDLLDTSMSALVHAITATKEITGREVREVTVIGSLAVVCRMGTPHRAITNPDIANRRGVTEQKHLELLIAGTGPAGQAARAVRSSQLPLGMFRSM